MITEVKINNKLELEFNYSIESIRYFNQKVKWIYNLKKSNKPFLRSLIKEHYKNDKDPKSSHREIAE